MPRYQRHVFVCQNSRPASDPRGCCASKGAARVLETMRAAVEAAGLKGRVRVNAAGCLGQCAHGVAVVAYPEAVWYGDVSPSDASRIAAEHVVGGRPVEDLRMPRPRGAEPDP